MIYAISENRCAGCYETVEFVWNRDEVNKKRIELELKYDMSFMITTFKSELDDVIPTPSLYVLMCGYSGIGGACIFLNKEDAISRKVPEQDRSYKLSHNDDVFEYRFDKLSNSYRFVDIIDQDDAIFNSMLIGEGDIAYVNETNNNFIFHR